MPDNRNYPAFEMGPQQAHPGAGRTLPDRLPMPITLSRLWMYSHRANSITKALFSEGMAGKSPIDQMLVPLAVAAGLSLNSTSILS